VIVNMTEITAMTAIEQGKLIADREISVGEAVRAAFNRIDEVDGTYNSFISIDREGALRRADEVQRLIDSGDLKGPLAGVPVAVKDNMCTEGMRTTCGSKMLEHFVPAYSATAVNKLKDAGTIIIGKTNMDEFSMGSTSETSYFGAVKNPVNPGYSAGGSSGGSASAVALGECAFALGSDTGGSIRMPASHCGVVGIKPTYGTVSRYGLVAYGSSLEQIGPMARSVSDCAAILDIISGYDKKDSTSVESNIAYKSYLKEDIKGMKIGIPSSYLQGDIDEDVKNAVLDSTGIFREMGAVVEEFDLGLKDYLVPTYYIIASAEAGSNLSRYDGVKYGYREKKYDNLEEMYRRSRSEAFGKEVKRRIMLGSFVLSSGYYDEYYLRALKVKGLIKEEFRKAFDRYDVILSPVSTATAQKLGESLNDPIKMYQSDIYNVTANLLGLPSISVPAGKSKDGLPIGLQLMADTFNDGKIIQTAYGFECRMEGNVN